MGYAIAFVFDFAHVDIDGHGGHLVVGIDGRNVLHLLRHHTFGPSSQQKKQQQYCKKTSHIRMRK